MPPAVLLLANDLNYPFTKTTENLAAACLNLGVTPYVRDTQVVRALAGLAEKTGDAALLRGARARWNELVGTLIDDAGIAAALALDLDWLVDPASIPGHPRLQRTVSLWFDDFRSWCTDPSHRTFPLDGPAFQAAIRDPRVLHCFYGAGMAREGAALGFANQRLSLLAAPSAWLACDAPCAEPARAGFIGNPGSRVKPSAEALRALDAGEDAPALRGIAFAEVATLLREGGVPWLRDCPDVARLVTAAAHARQASPWVAALDILQVCAPSFPVAWEQLNTSGHLLDAAMLVRLVGRYDRPGLVRRLWRAGLCTVYSNPEEWEPYGVASLPSVTAPDLPAVYRRHAVHLNAPNPLRDATANEKLFEIAACGRVSVNLRSPDVAACYDPGEIVCVESFAEAEEAVRVLMRDTSVAFHAGKRARLRTAREHTWEHRLRAILGDPRAAVADGA